MDKTNIVLVNIPAVHKKESQYIFKCLFEEFLGINYSISISEDIDFVINYNSKKITISNLFFNKEDNENIYVADTIPKDVEDGIIQINDTEFPLVSLYGPILLEKHQSGYLLKSDIIASTFFMLTRWEEKVNPNRDIHGRFPADSSCAVKFNFLERPIVNEYVEVLWELLREIGYKGKRKKRDFKTIPTHDVDFPLLWLSTYSKIRYFLAKAVQGRFNEISRAINYFRERKDPYDTYDKLMDLSEANDTKSYFFFLSGKDHKYYQRFDFSNPKVKSIIERIKSRGHHIGFHPSYYSLEEPKLFIKEKSELESASGINLTFGRQHFLRFEVPNTWKLWEQNGMVWDSTMSYPSKSGFRCGICYPFPVFDFEKRKEIKLLERPLIGMDATLMLEKYENLSADQAIKRVEELKLQVKKYNGEFVFLWHNSSFHVDEYYPFESLVEVFYG